MAVYYWGLLQPQPNRSGHLCWCRKNYSFHLVKFTPALPPFPLPFSPATWQEDLILPEGFFFRSSVRLRAVKETDFWPRGYTFDIIHIFPGLEFVWFLSCTRKCDWLWNLNYISRVTYVYMNACMCIYCIYVLHKVDIYVHANILSYQSSIWKVSEVKRNKIKLCHSLNSKINMKHIKVISSSAAVFCANLVQ